MIDSERQRATFALDIKFGNELKAAVVAGDRVDDFEAAPHGVNMGSSNRRTFRCNFSGETWYSSTPWGTRVPKAMRMQHYVRMQYIVLQLASVLNGESTGIHWNPWDQRSGLLAKETSHCERRSRCVCQSRSKAILSLTHRQRTGGCDHASHPASVSLPRRQLRTTGCAHRSCRQCTRLAQLVSDRAA